MFLTTLLGCFVFSQVQATFPAPSPVAPVRAGGLRLSDNYLAAAMQILQHLAEMLPYEFEGPTTTRKPASNDRPATTPKPVTTVAPTVAPTKPHKPGYYGPEKPPGPNNPDGRELVNEDQPYADDYLQYLPKIHRDLHEQLNDMSRDVFRSEDFDENDFEVIGNLLKNYGDYEELGEGEADSPFLKKKRVPPTKAYVEMLMLYDLMKRDAKTQNLQNFNGYSKEMLDDLVATSRGTAADQLRHVLGKMLERRHAKRPDVIARSKTMITDLANPSSALCRAIMYYEPLQFLK